MSTMDDDLALARRLQAEELANADPRFAARFSAPQGADAPLLQQNEGPGAVRNNMQEGLEDASEASPRILGLYIFLALSELTATIVVLALTWDQQCDAPLHTWILLFSGRLLFLVPLWVHRFRLARAEQDTRKMREFIKYANVFTFILFILGQTWVYGSETCTNTAHTLFVYCIVLVVIFTCLWRCR
eukprot:GABV01001222.1.p1 GENE.GABV01001222.1~~GABV01001222.1.p1  ORF type:complete len:198 (+),score=51.29 GABV01001222.1:35-595(+)